MAMKCSTCACVQEYVERTFRLLSEVSWIYDFQLTHVICGQTLSNIPDEWAAYLTSINTQELNQLPFHSKMDNMPNSLSSFIKSCHELSIPRNINDQICPQRLPYTVTKGMNPKKIHEVSNMASVVCSISQENNCPVVVDVGAGLGYLSAVIARDPSLYVLALECKEMLTHGTEARGINQGLAENLGAITYNLQDNDENFAKLRQILHSELQAHSRKVHQRHDEENDSVCSNFSIEATMKRTATARSHQIPHVCGETASCSQSNNVEAEGHSTLCIHDLLDSCTRQEPAVEPRPMPDQRGTIGAGELEAGICMIGLHCCGSLTPTMMKVFATTPDIRSFVGVSCCYHSLHQSDDGTWTHFPMSTAVREVMQKSFPDFSLSVFGMRLAAQETRARWKSQSEEDHNFHRNNVSFRALLQVVCEEGNLNLEKGRKHIANRKHMQSLEDYITAVIQRTNLVDQCPDIPDKLREVYEKNKEKIDLIEPFTALQVTLQPVLESLILIDRVLYLRESAIHATLTPIFDDAISPRNIAIIAKKLSGVPRQ